jgi:hypothetical protein
MMQGALTAWANAAPDERLMVAESRNRGAARLPCHLKTFILRLPVPF